MSRGWTGLGYLTNWRQMGLAEEERELGRESSEGFRDDSCACSTRRGLYANRSGLREVREVRADHKATRDLCPGVGFKQGSVNAPSFLIENPHWSGQNLQVYRVQAG